MKNLNIQEKFTIESKLQNYSPFELNIYEKSKIKPEATILQ